jgi:hypothetical protein
MAFQRSDEMFMDVTTENPGFFNKKGELIEIGDILDIERGDDVGTVVGFMFTEDSWWAVFEFSKGLSLSHPRGTVLSNLDFQLPD